MVERNLDWQYLVIAALVTVVVIGSVWVAGQELNNYKVDSIRDDIRQIEIDQRSQSLTFELTDSLETGCDAMDRWRDSSLPELRDLRKDVATYEDARKLDNPEYQNLKKRYMNLLIENMIQLRSMSQSCQEDNLTEVIYLYTKEGCDRCDDQGTILTYHRRQYDDQLMVYPLDTDLDMEPINLIEQTYNVTEYPTVIVEGEKHSGFQSREELGDILDKHVNQTVNNTDQQQLNLANITGE